MTLDPQVLRTALAPLFDPSGMPTGDPVAAWTQAYVKYAAAAIAGGTAPTTLEAGTATGPDFFTALDLALRTMWTAVAWVGPGLTGTTLLVPPLQPLIVPSAPAIIASSDPQVALSLIVAGLHTYTLSITVTVVPASGTPSVVPLA